MSTIQELIKLHEDFFQKLKEKYEDVYSDDLEPVSDEEIESLEKELNFKVHADVKELWKTGMKTYSASMHEDDAEWSAGWDLMQPEYVIRDTPDLRDNAQYYEESDPLKQLFETGIVLSFERPVLVLGVSGSIHRVIWGDPDIADPIAPDLKTFLEHWIATGCFKEGDFKIYWEFVKDIVPVQIPLKDNLWLQFLTKLYDESVY